jgi:hypothetical protein
VDLQPCVLSFCFFSPPTTCRVCVLCVCVCVCDDVCVCVLCVCVCVCVCVIYVINTCIRMRVYEYMHTYERAAA